MASGGEEHAVSAEPQCAEHNAYSECFAFANFKSVMDDTWKRYEPLNPQKGYLFEHLKTDVNGRPVLNGTGIEFIRGGIIATVAAWEGFVLDLFKEAFEILIKVGSGKSVSIENLKEIWPGCDAAITNGKKQRQKQLPSGDDDLTLHSRKVLEYCSIQPIFIGRALESKEKFMHIDEMFVKLFQAERTWPSLSQLVIEVGRFNYSIPYTGNWKKDPKVILQETSTSTPNYEYALKALNNISRLYYGLRCILVHSNYQKTLEGSLSNFPKSVDSFPLPTACKRKEDIAKHYTRLYCWIEGHNREIWVNYQTLLTITRFYKTAAYCLMLAVAKFLYDNYFAKADNLTKDEKMIWGYDPTWHKTEESEDPCKQQ